MQTAKKVIILGGGIAGLSAGYFSKKKGFDFSIYEAGETVGGNCRTINFGNFKIDTGAHRFHDKDDEMTAEMLSFMKNKVHEVNVPSYIFHRGKLIHFPLTPTDVFFNLHFSEVFKAAWYFVTDKFKYKTTENFETLVYQKYGRYISDLFLTNYSEKLWGEKCIDLSTEVAGSRLKNLNLNSIILEFLFRKKRSKHLEGAFYYPLQGFGSIAREMEIFCGEEKIEKNARVTKLLANNKRITGVEINGEKIVQPELLISTLPVTLMIKMLDPQPPSEIIESINKLKFRHIKLVTFLLNRKSVNNAATMYFPGKQYIFTRCYEPRNRSKLMSPEGKTSLVAEIPFAFNDTVDKMSKAELLEKTKLGLLGTKLICEQEIEGMHLISIPFAYPVLRKGFESEYVKLFEYLTRFRNFYISGRSGRFEYSWVHNMMRWGKEIIDEIEKHENLK